MAIPAKHRWILYAIALAITLGAVLWAGGEDRDGPGTAVAQATQRDARVERAPAPAAPAPAAAPAPEVQLEKLTKRERAAAAGDPFKARSWQPPVPPARKSAAPPPPPPQAPPLPFTYMGRLIEEGTTVVFLTKQDRNYIVRAGDTLDGTYGVETIDDHQVVLNYLPLGIRQTLSLTTPAAPGGGGGQVVPNVQSPVNLQGLTRSRAVSRDEEEEED